MKLMVWNGIERSLCSLYQEKVCGEVSFKKGQLLRTTFILLFFYDPSFLYGTTNLNIALLYIQKVIQ
jgi:hypothetical protein